MNVNLKGAAKNAYDGMKELSDFIDTARDNYDSVDELVSDAEELMVRMQPLLACYCIHEHFNGEDQAT